MRLLALIFFLFPLAHASTTVNRPPGRANNANILKEKLPNQVNAMSMVDKIKAFDLRGGEYVVAFWESSRVFRVPNNNEVVPCLENSFKSDRPVTLNVDQKSNTITECKMFGGTHPGMRGTNSATGSSAVE